MTPDELGAAWRDGKVHLPLVSRINGQQFGRPDAGIDMTFSFAQLIAHVTKTRRLRRRHHRRLGHRLQLRPQPRRELPRREAHAGADRARRAAHAVPASSATACRSRCSTRDGRSIFGALDNRVVSEQIA